MYQHEMVKSKICISGCPQCFMYSFISHHCLSIHLEAKHDPNGYEKQRFMALAYCQRTLVWQVRWIKVETLMPEETSKQNAAKQGGTATSALGQASVCST